MRAAIWFNFCRDRERPSLSRLALLIFQKQTITLVLALSHESAAESVFSFSVQESFKLAFADFIFSSVDGDAANDEQINLNIF